MPSFTNSKLAPGSTVPIGWVAADDPAQLFAPNRHEQPWAIPERLDNGLSRDATAHERMTTQSAWLSTHQHDRVI